ncbi:MAG TPA: hypothetical protein VG713_03490, partial [Pirellulales bacterium]|nr:hypothetical protein [Pirellulales bacterium]
ELVVVCAILAVLAGLVLPMVAYVRLQGDYAASATNAADLARLLRSVHSATNRFGQYDLLVDESGSLLSSLYTADGAPLAAMPVPSSYSASFVLAGLDGYYTSATTGSPVIYPSGTASLSLGSLATNSISMAALTASSTNANTQAIIKAVYPNVSGTAAIPNGTMLIAMGIGPQCSLIGRTLPSAPIGSQGTDDPNSIYCYFMAIFAIHEWTSGSAPRPATLVGVVDHRFNTADASLMDFKNAAPY